MTHLIHRRLEITRFKNSRWSSQMHTFNYHKGQNARKMPSSLTFIIQMLASIDQQSFLFFLVFSIMSFNRFPGESSTNAPKSFDWHSNISCAKQTMPTYYRVSFSCVTDCVSYCKKALESFYRRVFLNIHNN